jgi:methylated-DNA-protein-cysteine methyltransferase-like protein
MKTDEGPALHQRIFDQVEAIPPGKVATYGQIGRMVGGCSGQLVGFALASLRYDGSRKVSWQRVINRHGKISLTGPDAALQRALLQDEGVCFDPDGVIDLAEFGWKS